MRNYFDPIDNSYGAVPDGEPIPKGCFEVEAQPSEDFARHERGGKLRIDLAAKADHDAGADHIGRAHAIKEIEARLIKAGIQIDGILKAEAEALGMDLPVLVESVIRNAEAFKMQEVERRLLKTEGIKNA